MNISLCMIVKNESIHLEKTLKSVKKIVDEIIIVDTGSTDNTIEIAKKYTQNIYSYPWNDNFSDARNYSIEKATKDWILWIDADEALIINNLKEFKNQLLDMTVNAFSIKINHLSLTKDNFIEETYMSFHQRLFRNHRRIQFVGAIHEHIAYEDRILEDVKVMSAIELTHYGYDANNTIEKSIRNLTLLLREKDKLLCDLKEQSNTQQLNTTTNTSVQQEYSSWKTYLQNPMIDYHIAAELYRLNELEKSYSFLNFCIRSFLNLEIKPPSIVYKLKYDILFNTKTYDSAYIGIVKIIELYPDYVELHFYHGLLLYLKEDYDKAIKVFQYCLILGEDNSSYLIKRGNGTFHPYYYIGLCYVQLQDNILALTSFELALSHNPDFTLAKESLKSLKKSNT